MLVIEVQYKAGSARHETARGVAGERAKGLSSIDNFPCQRFTFLHSQLT
jgi:hypothetical protein